MATEPRLGVRLGLTKADRVIAGLVHAATLQHFDPLETLEDIPLRRDGASAF